MNRIDKGAMLGAVTAIVGGLLWPWADGHLTRSNVIEPLVRQLFTGVVMFFVIRSYFRKAAAKSGAAEP